VTGTWSTGGPGRGRDRTLISTRRPCKVRRRLSATRDKDWTKTSPRSSCQVLLAGLAGPPRGEGEAAKAQRAKKKKGGTGNRVGKGLGRAALPRGSRSTGRPTLGKAPRFPIMPGTRSQPRTGDFRRSRRRYRDKGVAGPSATRGSSPGALGGRGRPPIGRARWCAAGAVHARSTHKVQGMLVKDKRKGARGAS